MLLANIIIPCIVFLNPIILALVLGVFRGWSAPYAPSKRPVQRVAGAAVALARLL